jgi:hypothetical protein
VRTGGYG